MNELTQEKISIAVSNAIKDEKLMHMEVANIFNTSPIYFSYLKKERYWDKIPKSLWEELRVWMYSGQKLKGYKLPNKPTDIPCGVADEKLVETYKEQLKPQGPEKPPVNHIEPTKKKVASEGAKKFLKEEKEKKKKAEKRQEKFPEEIADRIADEISGEIEHSPMIAIVGIGDRRPESGIIKKFDLEVELRIKLKE